MPALADETRAKAQEYFKLYDADNSGNINIKELSNLVRALGYTPSNADLAAIAAKYDKNDDHTLSLDEFTKLVEEEELAAAPTEEELMEAFKVFDKDGSGALSKEELKVAMTSHGEKMDDDEVEAMLAQFDADGDGKIKYSEFVNLNKGSGEKENTAAASTEEKKSVRSQIDWEAIAAKLPTDKADADQKAKRKEMFRSFDPNGNGYLSLAEVDKGCRDVLELDAIFDVKPVMMRAFQAAKGVGNRKGRESKHGADFVEWREFRLLLVYLRQYFEVWQMFDEVDSADDKRVDMSEFKAALGKIESWGLKVDDAEAEFQAIDKNGGGQILFIEFADWALNKKLDLEDDDDEEEDA